MFVLPSTVFKVGFGSWGNWENSHLEISRIVNCFVNSRRFLYVCRLWSAVLCCYSSIPLKNNEIIRCYISCHRFFSSFRHFKANVTGRIPLSECNQYHHLLFKLVCYPQCNLNFTMNFRQAKFGFNLFSKMLCKSKISAVMYRFNIQ